MQQEIFSDDSFIESEVEKDFENDIDINELSKHLGSTKLGDKEPNEMEVEDMEFEIVENVPKKNNYILSKKSWWMLEEWKKVSKYNKIVEGTNILPIKTPMMRKKWLVNTKPEDQFDMIALIKELNANGNGKKVGLVIDLSETDSGYYNWDTLWEKNEELLEKIEYKKLKFGLEEIPTRTMLNKAYDILNKNLFKDQIVIIHCTRGVNKTGHAVAYFMCKRLGMKPAEAIKKFEDARGHPIEKKAIIDDLIDRFD